MSSQIEDRIIFAPSEKQSNVEIWTTSTPHTSHHYDGGHTEELITALRDIENVDGDCFIFLRQEYSWGHLLLAEHTFALIQEACNAFSGLNDLISSFAFKTSDRDEHFTTFDRKVRRSNNGDLSDHELCFLLRYPARHGRKSGCPFSTRSTGVYQRYDHIKRRSVWIFVQAPDEFAGELRNKLSSLGDREDILPFDVHRRIFSVAEQAWRDYICYLDGELAPLEEKAFFVDVDTYSESDYRIAFGDSQKLQRLRRKLVKCKEILDCSLEVAREYKEHWLETCLPLDQPSWQDLSDIDRFISRIKVHKRGVEAIQEHAEGTSTLLSQILSYRNENMLVKSNDALHKGSDAMREIALAAKAENEVMSALLGKAQKDSSTLKVLTYIALLYLPASLVAGIFNSNLVGTTNDSAGAGLVLSSSFWLYPCVTLALTVLTLLPVLGLLYYDKLYRRKPAQHSNMSKGKGA